MRIFHLDRVLHFAYRPHPEPVTTHRTRFIVIQFRSDYCQAHHWSQAKKAAAKSRQNKRSAEESRLERPAEHQAQQSKVALLTVGLRRHLPVCTSGLGEPSRAPDRTLNAAGKKQKF